MGVDLKVLVLSVVRDDLLYAKMTFACYQLPAQKEETKYLKPSNVDPFSAGAEVNSFWISLSKVCGKNTRKVTAQAPEN